MENENAYEVKMTESGALVEMPANVLGGADAFTFTSRIAELCAGDTSVVTLDLSRVEVMNSSGLGMLVSALSALRKAGKQLRLLGVPPKVMKLLEMTHLDEVFQIR